MLAYLLGLYFAVCLISQSAMDAAASFIFLYILVSLARDPKARAEFRLQVTGSTVLYTFLAFGLLVALGLFINPVEGHQVLVRLVGLKWMLMYFVLTAAVIKVNPGILGLERFCQVFLVCSLYAILIYFLKYDILKPDNELVRPEGVRTGGTFGNPMTFAHVYGIVWSFLFGVFLVHLYEKNRVRSWLLLVLAVSGLAVLFSGTRGVWIALAAASLVSAFFYSRKIGLWVTGILGASTVGLLLVWSGFRSRILQVFDSQSYDSERIYIWKANLAIFRDHPHFGVGYGENKNYMVEYFKKIGAPDGLLVSHAHNQYLHILSGVGAGGLVAFLGIYLFFFIQSILNFRYSIRSSLWYRSIALGTISAQICLFVGGLTEANFEHSKVVYTVLSAWAFIGWQIYQRKSADRGSNEILGNMKEARS